MDLVTDISVRASAPGAFALSWPDAFEAGPIDVFAGSAPARIDWDTPRAHGVVGECTIGGFDPLERPYFGLRRGDGTTLVVAQRNVPLQGSVNFRDIGGYATDDGRRVHWGRVFRSGHLANLTAGGRAGFERLGIGTVCDFRLASERAAENMDMPDTVRFEGIEIPPGVKDREYLNRVFRDATGPQDVADALHAIVLSMVNESADRYRRLFEVLLEPREHSVLINCSAGKERTGVATALLLSALGVPRETIYHDFMLSAVYFPAEQEIPRAFRKYDISATGERARQLVMPLLETRESYLRVALDSIDRECGDTLTFLRRHYYLGEAEIGELRRRYTG